MIIAMITAMIFDCLKLILRAFFKGFPNAHFARELFWISPKNIIIITHAT